MQSLLRGSLGLALWLAVAAGSLAACGGAATRPDGGPVGAAAELPPFTVRTVSGAVIDLEDHIGRDVILIDFWATWCKPCRAEFPLLQELYETYAKDGLLVLAISLDGPETQAEVRPFLRRNKYTLPAAVDEHGRIAAQLNPRSTVPLALVFDRSGRRVKTWEGFQLGAKDELRDLVVSLLAPAAPADPAPSP
jgi:thiol-disulfide isomerase/thioredoxin